MEPYYQFPIMFGTTHEDLHPLKFCTSACFDRTLNRAEIQGQPALGYPCVRPPVIKAAHSMTQYNAHNVMYSGAASNFNEANACCLVGP